jgi:Cu-Zn family superoxide dismutase
MERGGNMGPVTYLWLVVVGWMPQSVSPEGNVASDASLPSEAVAVLRPTQGNQVRGIVELKQHQGFVHITGRVHGLSPGKYGFHIHEYGDLRAADGSSAGDHYNPSGLRHGSPTDRQHHAGDLGNIVFDENGVAVVDRKTHDFKLHFVIGRAIVVHGRADDLTSQPAGAAGPRVAVGVIGVAQSKAEGRSRR